MVHPQEIEVWYVIPAIRREIAANLVAGGWTQRKAAKALGITEAAVSQYSNAKRGKHKRLAFSRPFLAAVKKVSSEIASGRVGAYFGVQFLVKRFRQSKELCSLHCAFDKEKVPRGCDVCL